MSVLLLLTLAAIQAAPTTEPAPGQGSHSVPTIVRKEYDMSKLAAPPALAEPALAGRRLFAQRCGVCHDPVGQGRVPGPWLDRDTFTPQRDEHARRAIAQGTPRMPGFQHTLRPAQVEQIVAFLKSVTPEQNPRAVPR